MRITSIVKGSIAACAVMAIGWQAPGAQAAAAPDPALAGVTPLMATPLFAAGDYSRGGAAFGAGATTLESVRWRPRRGRDRDRDRDRDGDFGNRAEGFTQIHAGFYDPEGHPDEGFLGGLRIGAGPDQNVRFGLGVDWVHKSDRNTVVVSDVPLPGGGSSERRLELARSSSNLFPLMAFVQLSPGNAGGVQPYFGVGGGYEVLFLSADDFETGTEFDATYGGWGWQLWGGLQFPLSGDTRLVAEVYRNTAEVERDVDDDPSGLTFREIVDMDGAGLRFGLNWGF